MNVNDLDINGTFLIERVGSLPVWSPNYVGRIIYNTSDNTLYVGKSTGWEEAGGSFPVRRDWDAWNNDGVIEVFLQKYIYLNLKNHGGSAYVRITPQDIISHVRGGGSPFSYNIRLSTGVYGTASLDPTVPYIDLDWSYINLSTEVYVKVLSSLGSEVDCNSTIVVRDPDVTRPKIFNPSNTSSSITLSESNKLATNINNGTWHMSKANYDVSTSTNIRSYWEVTVVSAGSLRIGAHIRNDSNDQYTGNNYDSYSYDNTTGNSYRNGSATAYGNTYTVGDVIGIAVHFTASWDGEIWFSKNGVWQNSGDPVAGTNPAYTGVRSFVYLAPAVSLNGTASARINLGDTPFVYTPPTGFTDPLV